MPDGLQVEYHRYKVYPDWAKCFGREPHLQGHSYSRSNDTGLPGYSGPNCNPLIGLSYLKQGLGGFLIQGPLRTSFTSAHLVLDSALIRP
ncbi:hypothetical protein TNCV_3803521 [Trichonephila clavipes]|nr:hypothetical protein TNCV_3803521 [Trichonephila clavipes]